MNAIEIGKAVTNLTKQPFDADEFPFSFLQAFDHVPVTIARLRHGDINKSDIGGVLLENHIHLKTCQMGLVRNTLAELNESTATRKQKCRFILATDGSRVETRDLISGDAIACDYLDLEDHLSTLLPLAGIYPPKEISGSTVDIKAASRLNQLHRKLLADNPDWKDRRDDMNHFMARLIFLFFAEDTGILNGENLFTTTMEQMSEPDGSNTHEVIQEMFRAMNLMEQTRAELHSWVQKFPYVNGGLFSHDTEVPVFTKATKNLLSNIGLMDWTKINPDIFGSMIQAVADKDERSAGGIHYTSVPNIMKVLNPLFLNDLNDSLKAAGSNKKKLNALRDRMSKIRVFDPACGSGNFLVIAYKEMRGIEAKLNEYCGTPDRRSEIPLTNFRGIELNGFSAEIARLALVIAEYQCNEIHRGQKKARAEFLPLTKENWITQGNALKLDWQSVCPPVGTEVNHRADDLLTTTGDQAQVEFSNEGGEIYICGNPPYLGFKQQSCEQKNEIKAIFGERVKNWKSLDYIAGWFMKAAYYGQHVKCSSAFVSTNSICQGQQALTLWPEIFGLNQHINFAYNSFKWINLASHNAGVTVSIVGISNMSGRTRELYSLNNDGEPEMKQVDNINAYLTDAPDVIVKKAEKPLNRCSEMTYGNMPLEGGHLVLTCNEASSLQKKFPEAEKFIFNYVGSQELIRGNIRRCLWIEDNQVEEACLIPPIARRLEGVRKMRLASKSESTRVYADKNHQFRQIQGRAKKYAIVVPIVSSENREYLPVGVVSNNSIVSNSCFALYDAPDWNISLIASKMHRAWIDAVCGKLETRIRYSNTMGWNTFPVPFLTKQNKKDMFICARDIFKAREKYFPTSIAELYKPGAMPDNLREAHERNDELIERIYVGRRFKNDTDRLETLFRMYVEMTNKPMKDVTLEQSEQPVNRDEELEMSF